MTLEELLALDVGDRIVWAESGEGGTVSKRTTNLLEFTWDDGIVSGVDPGYVAKHPDAFMQDLHKEETDGAVDC